MKKLPQWMAIQYALWECLPIIKRLFPNEQEFLVNFLFFKNPVTLELVDYTQAMLHVLRMEEIAKLLESCYLTQEEKEQLKTQFLKNPRSGAHLLHFKNLQCVRREARATSKLTQKLDVPTKLNNFTNKEILKMLI